MWYFILGNNPALSIAEITAVLGQKNYRLIGQEVLLVDDCHQNKAQELITHLGGTIKIGQINTQLKDVNNLLTAIKPMLKPKEGKYKFGFSVYGHKFYTKPLAMEIKKYLKEQGTSCRWVTSQETHLSSVVVEQNKLINQGLEIVIIKNNNEIFLGQTLAVQPFKELSRRDYGRPARDDKSGMLPPKLAQIMINLSQVKPGDFLLDPFCGSGTILTEAMLMGINNLIGSDISAKAIEDSQKNIKWITENYNLKQSDCKLYLHDVTDLSKIIKKPIKAIVTEPYLGPQRGQIDIKKVKVELESLYSKSLTQFAKILDKQGRLVMIWPVFQTRQPIYLNPELKGFKIIKPLPDKIFLPLTKRQTIVYGRPGQSIWREIVILEK